MVRRVALCQKLEPMPMLILQILNRAATLCWLLFADFYIAAKAVTTAMPPWRSVAGGVVIAGLVLLPSRAGLCRAELH
jgi:hypothetical protein